MAKTQREDWVKGVLVDATYLLHPAATNKAYDRAENSMQQQSNLTVENATAEMPRGLGGCSIVEHRSTFQ